MVEGPGRLRHDGRPRQRQAATTTGWNHNIHYHPLVLTQVPPGARRALDVGCGAGTLVRELSAVVPLVVGLDPDAPSLAVARREASGARLVRGDLAHHPFRPGSFDLVTAVAALHHLDEEPALGTMADLLRPGGRLVVIGLARSRLPRDLPWELASVVSHRARRLSRAFQEVGAPTCWPPPHTYDELRRIAERALPGVRFRRHLLWRCTLVWEKPPGGD